MRMRTSLLSGVRSTSLVFRSQGVEAPDLSLQITKMPTGGGNARAFPQKHVWCVNEVGHVNVSSEIEKFSARRPEQ